MIYDKISSKYFLILDDRNENAEGHGGELVKGKVYSFQNGQVVEEDGNLSINMSKNGISEVDTFFNSFQEGKILKIG